MDFKEAKTFLLANPTPPTNAEDMAKFKRAFQIVSSQWAGPRTVVYVDHDNNPATPAIPVQQPSAPAFWSFLKFW